MSRYRVEVRGVFAGTDGTWRPAIAGTLNQTGRSDAEASTFDSETAAEDAAAMVLEAGAAADEVRIATVALAETIRGVRLFRGDSTSQLTHDGRKADPELWYLEPVDYDGDVLWSKGYGSRAEAYHAAGLSEVSE